MTHSPLLKLSDAAVKYGLPSESTIKTEAKRGNIQPRRIGRCLYVTDDDMQGMIERCRESYCPPAYNSAHARGVNRSTSSVTATTSGAQDMALSAAAMLKKR